MALFNFKRPTPHIAPAQAALNAHMASIKAAQATIQRTQSHIIAANAEINAATDAAVEVHRLSDVIDAAVAQARYSLAPAPDLSNERHALSQARSRHEQLADAARGAEIARTRFQADLTQQHSDLRPMLAATTRLIWDCVIERMTAKVAEFNAAEAALRAIHREVFIAARAADDIAIANGYGIFMSADLYGELNISRPMHDAYWGKLPMPEEAQRARVEDIAQLKRESEAFVNALVNDDA